MKPQTDHERLLTEVLATEADADFSAGVLAATLRQARQQRRWRRIRQSSGALVVLLAIALGSCQLIRRGAAPETIPMPPPVSYELVLSQPLRSSQIASTTPLTPLLTVASTATASLVQTAPGGFGEIGDDELMALAAPNVVALVRRGPHEAELVFVSAPAEASSPPN